MYFYALFSDFMLVVWEELMLSGEICVCVCVCARVHMCVVSLGLYL